MVDRSDANRKMLNETSGMFYKYFSYGAKFLTYAFFEDIQNKTKEAIWRIQQQGAEAEGIGNETLQVLRHQGQQMVWKKILIMYIFCSTLHFVFTFC